MENPHVKVENENVTENGSIQQADPTRTPKETQSKKPKKRDTLNLQG